MDLQRIYGFICTSIRTDVPIILNLIVVMDLVVQAYIVRGGPFDTWGGGYGFSS